MDFSLDVSLYSCNKPLGDIFYNICSRSPQEMGMKWIFIYISCNHRQEAGGIFFYFYVFNKTKNIYILRNRRTKDTGHDMQTGADDGYNEWLGRGG